VASLVYTGYSSLIGRGAEMGGQQRRSRLEVVYSILHALHHMGPLRKTRLMQLVNLNTRSFSSYVDGYLVPLGLVASSREGGYTVYRLTSRGALLYRVLGFLRAAGLLGSQAPGGAAGHGPRAGRLACSGGEAEVVIAGPGEAGVVLGLAAAPLLSPGREGRRLVLVVQGADLAPARLLHGADVVAVVVGAGPGGLWGALRRAAELLGCGEPLRLEPG